MMRRWIINFAATLLLLGLVSAPWAARTFDSGYLLATTAIVSAAPFSVSVWFMATNNSAGNGLWGVFTDAQTDHRYSVYLPSNTTIGIHARDTGETNVATTTAFTLNTWNHACAVFASSTSRTIYLNGDDAGKGVSTVSRIPAGMNRTLIGATPWLASILGRVGEVGVWSDTSLTLQECQALAQGVSPQGVRREALISHVRVDGELSPEIDDAGAFSWAITGTAAKSVNHPPVFPYRR